MEQDSPDQELVRSAAAGNASAFEQLVRRYFPRIFSIARAHLKETDSAEDLAQETFLRAYVSLRDLKNPGVFAPWLVRIARNLAVSWIRDGKRRSSAVAMVPLTEPVEETLPSPLPSPREKMEESERARLVWEAVQRLPQELREVVLLHYAEGLSKSEIGRTLGVHDSTVGRQIDRARTLLRAELDLLLGDSLRPRSTQTQQVSRAMAVVSAFCLLPEAARAAVLLGAGSTAGTATAVAGISSKFGSLATSGGSMMAKGKLAGAVAAAIVLLGTGVTYFQTQRNGERAQESDRTTGPAAIGTSPAREYPVADSKPVPGSLGVNQEAETGTPVDVSTATLAGLVLDEQNQPVSGASVLCASTITSGSVAETSSSAAGVFELAGLREGATVLRVESPRHVPALLRITAPARDVKVRLSSRGAAATGHVFHHATGEAVPGCTVRLYPARDGSLPERFQEPFVAATDSMGAFRFELLPAGPYRITARKGSTLGLLPAPSGDPVRLSLGEGETTDGMSLQVYEGHTVRGTVTDRRTSAPLPGAAVALGGTGETARQMITDGAGTYVFDHVFSDTSRGELSVSREGYAADSYESLLGYRATLRLRPDELTLTRNVALTKSITISGRVLDEAGAAIQGARVCVYRPAAKDYESHFVLSEANGHYSIPAQPDRNVRLRAGTADRPAVFSSSLMVEDVPLAGVDIVLGQGGVVHGTVRKPDGHPAAGATISAVRSLETYYGARNYDGLGSYTDSLVIGEAHADDSGRFSLLVPPLTGLALSAKLEGFGSSRSADLILRAGEVQEKVELKLEASHVLGGRVTTPDETPVADANVTIYLEGCPRRLSTQTDDFGRFRFTDLPETACNIYVDHPRYGSRNNPGTWQVGNEQIHVILGGKTFTLIGQVVDDNDNPFSGSYSIESDPPAHKDPLVPGRFSLRNLSSEDPPTIRITASGYSTLSETAKKPGEGQDQVTQTFRLTRPGSLTGRIVEKGTGKPVSGARVAVKSDGNNIQIPEAPPLALATASPDGRFRFEGLSSKKVLLLARQGEPPLSVTKAAEVIAGRETDVGDLEIGSGATIRGRLVRGNASVGVPETEIALMVGYARLQHTITDRDGRFSFHGVAAGNYRVGSTKFEARASVTVVEDRDQEVEIRLGATTLRGRVLFGKDACPAKIYLYRNGPVSEVRERDTDSSGFFEISDLAAGSWSIQFNPRQKHSLTAYETLVLREGETVEREFRIPRRRIVGEVTEGGRPAAGVVVRAAGASGGDVHVSVTDTDGRFITDVAKPGSYAVSARKEEGSVAAGAQGIEVPSDGDSRPVSLRLSSETGTLLSTVYDMGTGRPLPQAYAEMPGFAANNSVVRYDENGTAKVTGIPPGTYTIRIRSENHTSSERTVEIRAGETAEIQDVLSEAGNIHWTLTDKDGAPQRSMAVRLEPVEPGSIQAPQEGVTDGQGVCYLNGVMPGSYRVTASSAGRPVVSEIFTVTAGRTEKRTSIADDPVSESSANDTSSSLESR